ncbi:J domain-containing protein [Cronbergia sp. UHCC 0137]|uniref:J domain-containing protein n=1 Tax=Cronbergia sp. UHCC 0137 TaxID=3110239 RepID=UPI002B21E67C|nr:J domain-containing protein [Cronbergia sp. UHCC 0137]MEA5617932.1 J domain-containing protein [Cronbergia sp. UHCC 0137]
MPRKKSSASPAQPTTPLALSELHIHLQGLEKEHQSLLKQIKKKRTELNKFIEQMRNTATEVFQHASPCFKKMADLDQEIHALFKEIFSTRKFGKQTRKNVENIYYNLQMSGVISQKPIYETEAEESEEMPENGESEDFAQEGNQHRRQYWEISEESEFSSGGRTDESRKIRQTFLRLAEIFHPDKTKDSEMQESYTEIMKEINKAYEEGDLARLLEIERQHDLGESIDHSSENDLARRCQNLVQQNEILKNQYDKLKQELREAKKTPEGAMVSDARKAAKKGVDTISLMVETLESQIEVVKEIRDFVKKFKEQKMTIKEFTAGPKALSRDMMEEMLAEMMEELGVGIIF